MEGVAGKERKFPKVTELLSGVSGPLKEELT